MDAGIGTLGLSLLAGVLSILSPCVFPLLPVVAGAALASHRRGPIALAAGLALSFTLAGVALGTVGLHLGLDQGWLRTSGAVILALFGAVLLSAGLQARLSGVLARVGTAGSSLIAHIHTNSLSGQFLLGLLLGVVWAPCVGPTLGVALTLASQGRDLAQVTLVMLVFAIGAALPLALVGDASRRLLLRNRASLLRVGAAGKLALGIVLLIVGVSILTGFDHRIEAVLVEHSPAWLTDLTTRF